MSGCIFYFSGTGNSLAVAKRIQIHFENYRLASIASFVGKGGIEVQDEKIGLVFPAYFGGLPNIVQRFIRELRFSKESYIFGVATAGYPWSCFVFSQINGILRKEGRKISAGFYVPMVDNYLRKYTIPPPEKQQVIYANCEIRLHEIIDVIGRNESRIPFETAFYAAIAYPFFMRRIPRWDSSFHIDGKCNSCGICERVCPVDNIRMVEGKPQWNHQCEFCMACINFCPQATIQWQDATSQRGRYHHKDVSVSEIIQQKNGYR